ncbi:hypothetical protein VPH35_036509 [Triticum aestivum]
MTYLLHFSRPIGPMCVMILAAARLSRKLWWRSLKKSQILICTDKELQEMEDCLKENTCDTISEVMAMIFGVDCSGLAAKYDNMCEVSDEEIIQNGKKWMTKEVMLAFEKYAERNTNLKGLDWQIEELCHQCFNVEYHHKVFHHYNFTVKIESPSSSDSRVALFFAEVKEIFGRKYYFCCPLEPNENGGYDRGSLDIAFPFTCMD